MHKKFLQEVKLRIGNANPSFVSSDRLEFNNIFGAVGGYVDGCLFITCGKFGLALKLPRDVLTSLFESDDVEQLRYFPKGHIKKEYAVIPERIYGSAIEFRTLMDKSMKYVKSE